MTDVQNRKLLKVLAGEAVWPPPAWLMRQAGRYLPEYRAVRAEAGSFLDLCYSPDLATEVTLQPIRRFGFDAAILFSDILVVPDALGRRVSFEVGEGPRLDPLSGLQDIGALQLERVETHLAPVIEAVRRIRAALPAETAFLGFCGGPWTVATYMIAGRGSEDQAAAKHWAYAEPQMLDRLIEILVEASIRYLVAQLEAGADAVQIFESWAGSLDSVAFQRFVIEPAKRIVSGVRKLRPGARIIGFPRASGASLIEYAEATGVDAVGLDWSVDPVWAAKAVPVPVQGNLDPMRLLAGEAAIDSGLERLFGAMRGRPFIFNLGHGITPGAPIAMVEHLMRRVREG